MFFFFFFSFFNHCIELIYENETWTVTFGTFVLFPRFPDFPLLHMHPSSYVPT